MIRAKFVTSGTILEQVKDLNTWVCRHKEVNKEEENIIKYNNTGGVLKRHYNNQLRTTARLRFHIVVSKTNLVYGSKF
jgi:hypothetical protein